jgi:hypothetical protein
MVFTSFLAMTILFLRELMIIIDRDSKISISDSLQRLYRKRDRFMASDEQNLLLRACWQQVLFNEK